MILYICMGLFLLNAIFIKPILARLIYAAQIVFCNKLLKLVITTKTNYYKRYDLKLLAVIIGYFLLLIILCGYLFFNINAPYIIRLSNQSMGSHKLFLLLAINLMILSVGWMLICIHVGSQYFLHKQIELIATTKFLKKNGLRLLKICIFIYTRSNALTTGAFFCIFADLRCENGWWKFETFEIQVESNLIKLRDSSKNMTVYYSYSDFLRNFKI